MDGSGDLAFLLVVWYKRPAEQPAEEMEARDLEAGSSNPQND